MNHRHPFAIGRRQFLSYMAAAGAMAGASSLLRAASGGTGRLKQGICRGVFRGMKIDLDGMCREAARLGVAGMDLVGPDTFATLKKHGLVPTMVPGGSGIKQGINNPQYHADIDRKMRDAIRAAAAAGAPNVIVLAGDRAGMSDAEGADHAVAFLNGIKALAEEQQVTLCIELLNSKVNHPGYMADHTAWGVDVCKRVNSPRVKLLYDIYHMQIMEGDVIRTLRDNIQYIAHFHTAGNPGRHEFDDTQELNYPAICRAIADTGFEGFLSHEYTPTRDPLGTLEKMIRLCTV
ncbi:MAG: TIM barrel protein [Verrucomicrobia bacterium]|nr:TIM barrel protein [Verrucomicrobiota bacterium]